MSLPIKKLLKECQHSHEVSILLKHAEKTLKNWEPIWSLFISAPVREEALNILAPFYEVKCFTTGGYPNAERHRICFYRQQELNNQAIPILGLSIRGDFLFENARTTLFRKALEDFGVTKGSLGDLWLTGDRGAQCLCTPNIAESLNGIKGSILGVEITCKLLNINELNLPVQRIARVVTSVEASTRVDAIASAGFGISRAKISTNIEKGLLRVNWITIKQPSKSVQQGDRIHLEKKGCLEVIKLERTKKERWRVELLRK